MKNLKSKRKFFLEKFVSFKKNNFKIKFKIKFKLFLLPCVSILLITLFTLFSFYFLTSCSKNNSDLLISNKKEANNTQQQISPTPSEENSTSIVNSDNNIKSNIENNDSENQLNYYYSNSKEFVNYSFRYPSSWNIYQTDGGKRVVIENVGSSKSESINNKNLSNVDSNSSEGIFIFVINKDNFENINSEQQLFNNYINSVKDDNTAKIFDEELVNINQYNFKLTGYEYKTKLIDDDNKDDDNNCIDYFTVIQKNNNFYCFKYFGVNQEKQLAKKTFIDFLNSFKFEENKDGLPKINTNNSTNTDRNSEKSKINILILGDDSGMGRPGGRVNGRTDIIILLHLNLETCKGTAVTIPRDTWVNIPGHGEGKINGAHSIGGNELTVMTVEQLSGLDIDNYIITDFDGFIPLIDFLGGVTIEIGENLNDGYSGCYLTKGVHHLDGATALALARNRHRAGDGTTQGGAFAREREAAKIIVNLLDQKSTIDRIIALPFFVNYLLNYTWTDLSFKDVIRFLPILGKIKANDIEITGIPSWPQTIGNASAVVYDKEATAELFEEIKNQ